MKLSADAPAEELNPPQCPAISADELLDAQPWGVLVLDAQRIIRRINQLAASWCGALPATLLGQPLAGGSVPPALSVTLQQLLDQDAAPGEVFLPQQAHWISFSATRQAGGWVLYGQDITFQKQREQQYQTLAENTPDVLTRWGPDLRLHYANAALATKTGQPLSSLLGRTFAEMDVPADIAGPYMAALQRVFDTGQPQEHTNSFPNPHGTREYHSRLVPELRDGAIDTVLGIARDITELKHTQAELLHRATDQYHALFQSMDQGFCVLQLLFDDSGQHLVDFRYQQLNPVFSQQSGIPEGAQGKTARELMPDLESFWFDTYAHVARTGESVRLAHYVPQVDRWFDVQTFRVGARAARQVGVLFHDITARKRHEANLVFLAEISQDLVGLTSIDETMATLGAKLGAHFHASACVFTDVDEAAELFLAGHDWHRADGPSLKGTYRYEDFHSEEFRQASRAGETYVVRDSAADPRVNGASLAATGIGAFVNVPLVRDGAWRFNLGLCAAEPRDWRPDEVELLRELTTRIWTRLERARAEEALAASEEKYRSLFNSIDEGFCTIEVLFDAQGQPTDYRFLEANPTFERQTGLANAVGRTMRELAPAHEAFWFETYGRVARTGEPVRIEHEAAALGRFYDVHAFRIGEPAAYRVAILFHDVMPRKRAEEALRRSEEKLRLFVTASSDILYRMDADWQHMLVLEGKGFLVDTRASHATWLETYIPPVDQALVAAAIQAAIAGPTFFALEHRVVRADGSIGWTYSHAVPMLDAQGGLVEWFGAATDITARKQAEEALRASEATLAVVFEALPMGVGVFAAHGQLTLANRQMQHYLPTGIMPSFDDTQLLRWRAYHLDGRLLERTEYPGARALRGEKVLPGIEMLHTPVDGPEVWTQVIAVPLPDGNGHVSGHVTVILDIDALKRTEEALRVSEAKYRTLFETMDQGFGVAELLLGAGPGGTADFRWLEVNPQVERLTGMPQAALLSGETMRNVMPQLEDSLYEQYEQVARTGEPKRFEQHAQVLGRWFDVYVYALDGPASRRIALLFTNITARKQAEEALLLAQQHLTEFNAKLERRVTRRTQQLQASRDLLQSVFDTNLIAMSVLEAVRDDTGAVQDFRLVLVNKELERETGRTDLVGKLYIQASPGIRNAGLFELAVRTVETGEPQGMEYYYPRAGSAKWYACQFTKLGDGVVAINLDITERKLAEQARARNLHLLEQAEAVAQMGSWDYDLRTQEFLWSEGMYRLFNLPTGQPVGPPIYLDYVVDEDRPLAEQLVQCLTTGSAGFEDTLRLRVGGQLKTVRIKTVVLIDETGQPVRVLGVDLDISDLQRLEADNLNLRLSQQRVLFEAVQVAQEAERKRMAESLHNGIGQMLYATKLRLDQLHAPVLHTLPALVAARNEADQLLSEAIRQTRALSHELVPLALEDFGLVAALRDIGRKMSTPPLHLRCQVVYDEDAAALSPALQMALYRMAQELAQNIVKHAQGATEASLELETMPGWVLLRAEDNGVGFATAPVERPGLGLRSIRDRVTLLGGQLETGAASEGGAFVRIRIPLVTSPTV